MVAQPYSDDIFAMSLMRNSVLRVDRGNLLHTAMTLRVVAEGWLRADPALANMITGIEFMMLHWERSGREFTFFGLAGSNRQVMVEGFRCIAMMKRTELRLSTERFPDLQEEDGDAAAYLLRMDKPMEAVTLLNETADWLDTTAYRLTALDRRLEALSVLQWTRHQLTSLSERRAWWRTASETLTKAMTQAAAGQDWATLAELIETARLQLGPQTGESAIGLGGTTAPFIRVRGTSQLEQATWYWPGEHPASYNLEDMAAYVLGEGTWWWSTWSAGDNIFWALVPPDGRVSGGVMPAGRDSAVAEALAELRNALPIAYPGEDDLAFMNRVFGGPLCGPLAAELELSRRLGELLPKRLRRELVQGNEIIKLAIAPAPELANVPWSLVVVPAESGQARLIECAEIAIAPPAALLAASASRSRSTDRLPLSLAVLNPAGDLAQSGRSLQKAGALVDLLPTEVRRVTAQDAVTVTEFGAILRDLPSESSAIFACHTAAAGDSALSTGLALRPAVKDLYETPEILTAAALIQQPELYPMPRQAMLLACESADLRQVVEGEWLVLGPAMMWAGAERLIVTNFPVLDGAGIDSVLIQRLLDGDDLSAGLRQAQLAQLDEWRSTGGAHVWPLYWSSHIAMGAYGDQTLRSQGRLRNRYVHESVTKLFESAAVRAGNAGRSEVEINDLLLELTVYGYDDDFSWLRKLAVRAVGYPIAYGSQAFGHARGRRSAGNATLSDPVLEILQRMVEQADNARHRVVDLEHLLVALLARGGVAIALARLLSGWDPRQPEVVKEMLSESQERFQYLGMPQVVNLSPDTVRTIYRELGAELPDKPSEPVLLSDLRIDSGSGGAQLTIIQERKS